MRLVFCVALALTFTPAGGSAQDLEAGQTAFDARDYATALREWVPLAEQGDATAQSNLGFMYDNGYGVPQDYVEAVSWYRKAAEQGDAYAQVFLGILYSRGLGVPRDFTASAKWYRKAAEQGDANGQWFLGDVYHRGQGVPQDYVSAHMWYNLGSGNGSAVSAASRDSLAAKMTAADISEAQRRARVCHASDYQDCG